MEKKVIIVGSGIAGLAAAIRLSIKGYQVTVFEANTYPGGKLSEITMNGYRFDAGPSLFTLPEQVEELFELASKKTEDYFQYKRLEINCNYFWEDGTKLSAYAEVDKFAEEVKNQLGESPENIKKALSNSAYIYRHLAPLFMHKSLHKWSTWFNKKALRSYLRMGKLGLFKTMNKANAQQFKHPKLVQLFNRYATYNGSNPFQTPATLNIIPHLEFNKGAFFPVKGMHDITTSLFNLSKELGVQFHFSQPVERILVKNKIAKGVIAGGKTYYYDLVINNMDMVTAYKTILKEEKQPKRLLKQPKSSSALIFYWGIKKNFPELELHNILFSNNYEKEFKAIFEKKDLYEDPTVYINITSIHKKDDAPEGSMNWFTMINVPNNQGQDWDKLKTKAKEFIVKKINATLNTDIEPLIEVEQILDPIGIETKTSSANGALYGNSSNNKYAAFLRHPNYSSAIDKLYFCGGSVHPGGGIPLCLLSAKIMADMIPNP
ncbi:1-hydroxycarotenoid 3,4-desaturase CrtD [uncultured Cyclobacterium sp.]|uniref:1-hydroxycarotenoid 3,4-desaturase CrtD n=1 Tax=uncultured Cyclobacterium sp. TaxID=453820 RepID=UPI0030EE48A6|tara:strand:+ start:72564 stop:74033 length:1470 start_codon:yes stop_codon:yes gene_type:complete